MRSLKDSLESTITARHLTEFAEENLWPCKMCCDVIRLLLLNPYIYQYSMTSSTFPPIPQAIF